MPLIFFYVLFRFFFSMISLNKSRGLCQVLFVSKLVIAFIYLVAPKGAVWFICGLRPAQVSSLLLRSGCFLGSCRLFDLLFRSCFLCGRLRLWCCFLGCWLLDRCLLGRRSFLRRSLFLYCWFLGRGFLGCSGFLWFGCGFFSRRGSFFGRLLLFLWQLKRPWCSHALGLQERTLGCTLLQS